MMTDQEENDFRGLELFTNFIAPFCSGGNSAIMPLRDHTLALQNGQMCFQNISKLLVFMTIREENLELPSLACTSISFARPWQVPRPIYHPLRLGDARALTKNTSGILHALA